MFTINHFYAPVCFPDNFPQHTELYTKDAYIIRGYLNQMVIGTAVVLRFLPDVSGHRHFATLYLIKIAKEFQNQGFGGQLLCHVLDLFSDKAVILKTDPNVGDKTHTHEQLKSFYEKHGAIVADKVDGSYFMVFDKYRSKNESRRNSQSLSTIPIRQGPW